MAILLNLVKLVYGADTWATTKSQERKLEVNDNYENAEMDVWSHEER